MVLRPEQSANLSGPQPLNRFTRWGPLVRLFSVIVLTSICVWINDLRLALVAFCVSLFIVLILPRCNYKLLFFIIFTTTISYTLGNVFFSPPSNHDITWWIFRINTLGLIKGTIAAAKRNAMLCFSLAWLWSTTFPETYTAVEYFDKKRYILLFLRNIQIIWREILQFRQSINTRSPRLSFFDTLQLTKLRLMIQAVLIRLFNTVARITYAAETHHGNSKAVHQITLQNVCIRYAPDKECVLKQINCSFFTDEFIYLAGINGAGKTTLLRLIAGYIPRIEGEYDGSLFFDNENAGRLSLAGYSKFVRYVPSDASLAIIGLTVGQEIMTIAHTGVEARMWLKRMGIEHLWSRETVKLSGGEQVRLVLACALAAKTSFILLDSPLEQLDSSGRVQFLAALKEVASVKGVTIIVADPNFDIFEPFTTRFLLIEDQHIADIPSSDVSLGVIRHVGIAQPTFKEVRDEGLGPPLAELRNVQLSLDGIQILRGINFIIRQKEFVAIIGENGSGKTTAMLALAGLLKVTKGHSFATCPVKYVFQDAFLQMVGINCEEELSVGPQFNKWVPETSKAFIQKELAWVEVEAKEQPVELHPGKARLLSIAAMNFNQGVLILDEPTIGLDDAGLKKIVELIQSIILIGSAVIAITHDSRLVKCAIRVIEMKEGRIISEIPDQNQPRNEKAKGLSTFD